MRSFFLLIVDCFIGITVAWTQSFPPQAGLVGSTAIHQNSSIIKSWAATCTVVRGPIRIDEPQKELATFGTPENAIGPRTNEATFRVVSLGDGGSATLTFYNVIVNGVGPDFVVFENGFLISGSDTLAFLELAFVEVSSDGQTFVRFPSVNEYTTPQLDGFAPMDARYIHNFAGKYIAKYGTPFDLEDLKDSLGIDINYITHVRVVDVVGNISPEYATYDSKGNPVNDPWSTPFPTCGFDLGGVGVINEGDIYMPNASMVDEHNFLSVYPNPAQHTITIEAYISSHFTLCDPLGKIILSGQLVYGKNNISVENLDYGLYFIRIEESLQTVKIKVERR